MNISTADDRKVLQKLHTCNCKDRKGIYLHVVYCSCNKLDILLRLAMQQTNIYILFILIDLFKEIFTPFIPTFLKQKMHSLEYLNFLNPKKVIEKKPQIQLDKKTIYEIPLKLKTITLYQIILFTFI